MRKKKSNVSQKKMNSIINDPDSVFCLTWMDIISEKIRKSWSITLIHAY